MKRLIAIMIAVFAPPVLAQTEAESVKTFEHNIIEYRFVGLTPEIRDGTIFYNGNNNSSIWGVAAMHRLCQATFGNEARSATIQEAFFRNDKHRDDRTAWVAPSGPMLLVERDTPSGVEFQAYDAATGVQVGDSLETAYCRRYEESTPERDFAMQGPFSTKDGTVAFGSCDGIRAVACSIPVRITATGLTKVTNGGYEK